VKVAAVRGVRAGIAGAAGLAVLAVLAVGLTATQTGCPWPNDAGDGGAAAACTGGPTLVQQCTSVFTTLCAQGSRCNIAVASDCVTAGVTANCPCAVEACDASSCETAGMVSTCQQDLESEDCNAIVNYAMPGYWPSDCSPFMAQQ
jgi:hypothetical protein